MRAACAALLHAHAALQQELVGPQQAREATAALLGLGKLGLDPGEKFAAAIMRLVEADGGRDPGLLAFTAWTLAICEVRRWGCSWMLLQGLYAAPPPADRARGSGPVLQCHRLRPGPAVWGKWGPVVQRHGPCFRAWGGNSARGSTACRAA